MEYSEDFQLSSGVRAVRAAPDAPMLIESMRDIGYSLETALADIVDNSITANARQIDIFADTTDSAPRIGVLDDGIGMTEAQLMDAMKPGSRNPLEARPGADLGRFGLGLKIASFSQCRRLTVVTRCEGVTTVAVWDLDYVAHEQDWLILVPETWGDIPWVDQLGESGTLVIWEDLDRLVDQNVPAGEAAHRRYVLKRIDDAREHLELVFHRFLSGEKGLARVRIALNGRGLAPFDPFHSTHPATVWGQVETIQVAGEKVRVQAFTLPHFTKVEPAEWERYAGRAGYVKNQGFYVYREKRLIINGTWFGLTRQTELTKLCRVRIDMPNGLDSQWKIDVKKASAQPPYHVRQRLRSIIEAMGAPSRRVYRGRGAKLVTDGRLPVWNRIQEHGEITYRVNSEHPVVEDFLERLTPDQATQFRRVIELIGTTLPMDALFADLGGEPEKVSGTTTSDETLSYAVRMTVEHLRNAGADEADIPAMLKVTEPFRSNWSRATEMLDSLLSIEVNND